MLLAIGTVTAKWVVDYEDDVLIEVTGGHKLLDVVIAFDDLHLNTTEGECTNYTKVRFDWLNQPLNNLWINITENVIDLTEGECNYTGDCVWNMTYEDEELVNGQTFNFSTGWNDIYLNMTCVELSCEVNRTINAHIFQY